MSILDQIKAKQQADEANPYVLVHQPEKLAELIAKAPENPPELIDKDPENPPEPFEPSLLAQVKAKQLAEADETGADSAPADAPGDLAHYQAAMAADLATLSGIKDIVEKGKAKLQMLPTYWPFVKAYVDNGDNYPNDVAVRVMIWLLDTFDIERGLDLAFHLIKQGIHVTPAKFDRDIPTVVCDSVYDWAAALLKADPPQSASPYLDTLLATIDNEQWSLAPPVHSKLFAMLAKHKARLEEWETVVSLCERAEEVNPEGAGVKKLKDKAKAKLAKAATPPAE
ncbi:phage terminase small subunit [Methylomonas sp. EFPC3]|uniref:phage terminase small subunit n=1 Tax=Methylomonas sp. EFPC3 TaxID=3021710 RepID=UPI0024161E16|nr:phage terminase small subunit [Methylomonas sp. EFPC3]WFP48520.1 phage terminase small subunit [Methylomonas sp. EFPC3]